MEYEMVVCVYLRRGRESYLFETEKEAQEWAEQNGHTISGF